MTRERAIEVLKHTTGNINWDANREEIYFTDEWVQAYEMAIAALKDQDAPDINVGNKWISVKDRLPKSRADVLVVAYWGEEWQTMTGWYSAMMGKWRIITPFGEREPGGVTHWMPLPEPPKEDAE